MILKIESGTSLYDVEHKMLNDLGFVDDGEYTDNNNKGVYLKYGNLSFALYARIITSGSIDPSYNPILNIYAKKYKEGVYVTLDFFSCITSGDMSTNTFSCTVSTYYYKSESLLVVCYSEYGLSGMDPLICVKSKNSTVFLGGGSYGNFEVDDDGTYTKCERYINIDLPSRIDSSCCSIIPLVLTQCYSKDSIEVIDNIYICSSNVPSGAIISINGKNFQRSPYSNYASSAICFPYVTSES